MTYILDNKYRKQEQFPITPRSHFCVLGLELLLNGLIHHRLWIIIVQPDLCPGMMSLALFGGTCILVGCVWHKM